MEQARVRTPHPQRPRRRRALPRRRPRPQLPSRLEPATASVAEPMAIPSQVLVQSQGGVADAKPDSKQGRRGVQRRVNSTQLRVRGVRHDPPDAKKIAKALVELAREQMADEPGRRHDPNAVSGESPPLPPLPADRPKPRRARHLDQDQVQMLVQGYAAGATTYELGLAGPCGHEDERSCHTSRPWPCMASASSNHDMSI